MLLVWLCCCNYLSGHISDWPTIHLPGKKEVIFNVGQFSYLSISFILQAWRVAPRQGVAWQAYMLVSPLTDGLCNHAQWTTLKTWFTGKVNSVIQADSQQEPQVDCGIVQLCYSLENTNTSLAGQLGRSNTVPLLKLAVQSIPSHTRNMLLPPVFHHHMHLLMPKGSHKSIHIFP